MLYYLHGVRARRAPRPLGGLPHHLVSQATPHGTGGSGAAPARAAQQRGGSGERLADHSSRPPAGPRASVDPLQPEHLAIRHTAPPQRAQPPRLAPALPPPP